MSLYYQIKNYVDLYHDKNTIENKLELSYNQLWDFDDEAFEDKSSAVKENWVIPPQ